MPPSHHICLEVEDIQASAAYVARSARLLDPQPKPGAHGTPVVFLHPKVRWAVGGGGGGGGMGVGVGGMQGDRECFCTVP